MYILVCLLSERVTVSLLLEHQLLRLQVPTETLGRTHEDMLAEKQVQGKLS